MLLDLIIRRLPSVERAVAWLINTGLVLAAWVVSYQVLTGGTIAGWSQAVSGTLLR